MLANHPRIRLAVYLASVLVGAGAIIAAVYDPQLGAALTAAAGVLGVASGAVAATNVKP